MEHVSCNLCGSTESRDRFRIPVDDTTLRFYRYARYADPDLCGTFRVVECGRCQLLYVSPRLNAEQLGRVYGDNRIVGGNWRTFASYLFRSGQPDDLQSLRAEVGGDPLPGLTQPDWRTQLLVDHGIAPGARVLDVGCGRGEFVARARSAGFDAVGVDRSPDRVRYAQTALGLGEAVQCAGDGEDWLPGSLAGTYDAITLFDVIEHLPDPLAALQRLRPYCHADTKLFVHTMSLDSKTFEVFGVNWYYMHPAIHLFYFSDATMAELFRRSGFEHLAKVNDHSRPPTVLRLLRARWIGWCHRALFKIYARPNSRWRHVRPLLRWVHRDISDARMARRVENLYPGYYAGRFRDDFVYVGRLAKPAAEDQSPVDRAALVASC